MSAGSRKCRTCFYCYRLSPSEGLCTYPENPKQVPLERLTRDNYPVVSLRHGCDFYRRRARPLSYREQVRKEARERLNLTPKVRRAIIERDGRRCAVCKSGGRLEVHHIDPGIEEPNSFENLITLCPRCHAVVSTAQRLSPEIYYEWIVPRLRELVPRPPIEVREGDEA